MSWSRDSLPQKATTTPAVSGVQAAKTLVSTLNMGAITAAGLADPPDNPDTLWAIATGDNVDTDVLLGDFTDPGFTRQGTQTARVAFRKSIAGRSTPDGQIVIESATGGPLVVGPMVPITAEPDGFQVVELEFEAGVVNLTNLRVRAKGFRTGGGPAFRNTCDIGAVQIAAAGVGDETTVPFWSGSAVADSSPWTRDPVASPGTVWTKVI